MKYGGDGAFKNLNLVHFEFFYLIKKTLLCI